MKTPKQRKRDQLRVHVLVALIEAWHKNPDLRLCQLVGNCFKAGDLYYVNDKVLLEKLKEVYEV